MAEETDPSERKARRREAITKWKAAVAPFEKPSAPRASWQIANSIGFTTSYIHVRDPYWGAAGLGAAVRYVCNRSIVFDHWQLSGGADLASAKHDTTHGFQLKPCTDGSRDGEDPGSKRLGWIADYERFRIQQVSNSESGSRSLLNEQIVVTAQESLAVRPISEVRNDLFWVTQIAAHSHVGISQADRACRHHCGCQRLKPNGGIQ